MTQAKGGPKANISTKIEASTIQRVWLTTLGLFGLMGNDGRKLREKLIKHGEKTQKKAVEKFEEMNKKVRDLINRRVAKEI